MPTYQYACTACDHRFERVQAFSDNTLADCPECTGVLRKVFSSVGIVFKGSGFYHTDSRGKGPKSESKVDATGKTADSTSVKSGSSEGSSSKSGSSKSGSSKSGSSESGSSKSGSSGAGSSGSGSSGAKSATSAASSSAAAS